MDVAARLGAMTMGGALQSLRRRPRAVALAVLALAVAMAALLDRAQSRLEFVEYPMRESRDIPTAIAAAPDGAIWFTIDLGNAMGRVREGRLERLPIAGNNVEPLGLGVDADGNAWYTDTGARGISRMTPAGEVTSFPLGTPIVRFGRLAVARDGAVWFAEGTGYSITRLKDGKIVRHVFASPRGDPYGVALAPDGSAWATLKAGNQLLHITADGGMQVIDAPRPATAPSDVAVGGDGAVWFIESRENRIGRLKDGKFDEFAVGEESAVLTGLTLAPDGALWFGMLRSGSLGRLAGGRVERYRLPRQGARPATLAVDRDGNVWYADISGYVGVLPARFARR